MPPLNLSLPRATQTIAERTTPYTLIDLLSPKSGQIAIHLADPAAQPHKTAELACGDPSSRALTLAGRHDIVVCRAVDTNYLRWLSQIGLGPQLVLAFDRAERSDSLTRELLNNPEPLRSVLELLQKSALLVPYYSGKDEAALAASLKGEMFGCPEELVQRFFDKEQFKLLCDRLSIPTVQGHAFDRSELDPATTPSPGVIFCRELLAKHNRVIIRGTCGSSGSSLYVCSTTNLNSNLNIIAKSRQRRFLVEPLLASLCSPNDQWAIGRDNQIVHMGTSRQLFNDGLRHIGNTSWIGLDSWKRQLIHETSQAIVLEMARQGYRGVIGIDYIVTPVGIYPVENNARFNGSTYAYALLDRLGLRQSENPIWYMTKAKAKAQTCSEALGRIGPTLYNPERKAGAIPIDVSRIGFDGTLDLLVVGPSSSHVRKSLQRLSIAGFQLEYRRGKNSNLHSESRTSPKELDNAGLPRDAII